MTGLTLRTYLELLLLLERDIGDVGFDWSTITKFCRAVVALFSLVFHLFHVGPSDLLLRMSELVLYGIRELALVIL